VYERESELCCGFSEAETLFSVCGKCKSLYFSSTQDTHHVRQKEKTLIMSLNSFFF